jgi:hypothetical protein
LKEELLDCTRYRIFFSGRGCGPVVSEAAWRMSFNHLQR